MRRKLLIFFAVLQLFLYSATSVFAEEGEPTPPQLYSQAAVLMDADTGQVLYGKNMHSRMYPASLTKVITCLLAMERLDPDEEVTMTDEGVFSVPRSTTHIALTTGEKLSVEQLEFAMMVESANDAANGLAIHTAGSVEAFAQLMNEKAQEIGAVDSHFTNANGLPDNNHYTSAYDLGLFTREALTYPEFRTLAGTQQYIIPPTNKQKEERILNNRQYMFTLNDTYPGAFAGKTGWTEEAGKTLITIAERDGITLICVVLKSSGTVDAEFKDSTNLLDYGYDHFKRYTVPTEKVPAKEVSFINDVGLSETRTMKVEGEMPVLLPENVSAELLQVQYHIPDPLNVETLKNAYVELVVPGDVSYMDSIAGRFAMTLEQPAVATAAETENADKPGAGIVLLKVLKWVCIVLILLIIVLLILRQILRARYLKRNKKMRMQRKRNTSLRSRPESRIDYIDVTLDKANKNKIKVIDKKDQ